MVVSVVGDGFGILRRSTGHSGEATGSVAAGPPGGELPGSGVDRLGSVLGQTGVRPLGRKLENGLQTAIPGHEVIQGDHVELVIEGLDRPEDEPAQPALRSQRTGILLPGKAFREGNARFENAKDLSDADIARPEPKLQPACPPADRFDKTVLLELMNDMPQMIARCIAGLGDVGRPDDLTVIDGAKHQHTGGKVCSGGQAHGVAPVATMDFHNMLF